MGTSALEILVLPVCWATLGGLAVGPMILAVMNAIEVLVKHLGRPAPAPRPAFLAGHTRGSAPRRVVYRAFRSSKGMMISRSTS
jgi:hypothetical protein